MNKKIALVTGANRGMGFATSEKLATLGFQVVMVARNKNDISLKAKELKNKGLDVSYLVADVSKKDDVDQLLLTIKKQFSKIDLLINNAGIYTEEKNIYSDDDSSEEILQQTLAINTLGPYRLMKGLIPLMIKQNYGRIVNVSSQLGSFHGSAPYCFSYSLSKASLNMLTNLFAKDTAGKNIKINSVCPGWVKTEMGGQSAPRSIEEGIAGILWAATLDDDGPTGGFFHDKKAIRW